MGLLLYKYIMCWAKFTFYLTLKNSLPKQAFFLLYTYGCANEVVLLLLKNLVFQIKNIFLWKICYSSELAFASKIEFAGISKSVLSETITTADAKKSLLLTAYY